MKKSLLTFFSGLAMLSIANAQCTFSNSSYGNGSAPTQIDETLVTSTCSFFSNYSTVTNFLSSTIYTLDIDSPGYITVFNSSNVAVEWGNSPLSFTPPTDGSYKLQWNGIGCTSDYNCYETTVTNAGLSAPCANPALGGAAISTDDVACEGQPLLVTLSGVSVGSGLTYQWQSSADGITFSDISTATSSSLSTTQSVLTYYQAIVTCSAGTIATSTPLMVEMGNCVVMTNGSDTTCNGIFYDSGAGNGNYSDYENTTMTLYPSTPGTFLQVNFYSFQLETCCDDLTVYNGNSTASPLLGSFSTNPGSITSTALGGSLTFTFSSDGSVTYFGWEASISCVEPPVNDDVCAAIAVSVDGSTNSYNNGGAGIQTDEQTIAPPASGDNTSDGWGDSTITASTWFMFDAPA
jgi:hypothetical protein